MHAVIARMYGWLTSGEYRAMVLELDDNLMGYCLYSLHENQVHVRQFFIRKQYRGHGCGRSLFDWCRKNWPKGATVTLDEQAQNEASMTFWEKIGFRSHSGRMELPVG